MFTSSKKREIRHFHVVVVQWRLREMYRKAWCTFKVVVLRHKPVAFMPFSFSLPSPSSLLKLPNGRGRGRGRWKGEKSPLPSSPTYFDVCHAGYQNLYLKRCFQRAVSRRDLALLQLDKKRSTDHDCLLRKVTTKSLKVRHSSMLLYWWRSRLKRCPSRTSLL